MDAPDSTVRAPVTLSVRLCALVPTVAGCVSVAPVFTVSVVDVIDGTDTLPFTVTSVPVTGYGSSRNLPAVVGPERGTIPFTPRRIGSALEIDSPLGALRVSKR